MGWHRAVLLAGVTHISALFLVPAKAGRIFHPRIIQHPSTATPGRVACMPVCCCPVLSTHFLQEFQYSATRVRTAKARISILPAFPLPAFVRDVICASHRRCSNPRTSLDIVFLRSHDALMRHEHLYKLCHHVMLGIMPLPRPQIILRCLFRFYNPTDRSQLTGLFAVYVLRVFLPCGSRGRIYVVVTVRRCLGIPQTRNTAVICSGRSVSPRCTDPQITIGHGPG